MKKLLTLAFLLSPTHLLAHPGHGHLFGELHSLLSWEHLGWLGFFIATIFICKRFF